MTDELELDWGSRKPRGADQQNEPQEQPPPEARDQLADRISRIEGAGIQAQARSKGLPPGHPNAMPQGLLFRVGRFFSDRSLRISQAFEVAQALVGWDQANRYSVRSEDGSHLFTAAEQSSGVLGALSRNFNPFYRNTTDCLTDDGSLFMRLTFPFRFLFKRCEVLAWNEQPLGAVQNRFHLLKYRGDIMGTNDAVLLEVHGPWLKILSWTDWEFEVRKGERVVARIKKHWSGFFKEAFSTSDKLSVEFEDVPDPRLRQLVFAAALMVDKSAFEQRGRRQTSLTDLLTG